VGRIKAENRALLCTTCIMILGFIAFTIVSSKPLKFGPNFVQTLNKMYRSKPILLLAPNFDLISKKAV
jgi:hypothetical protein